MTLTECLPVSEYVFLLGCEHENYAGCFYGNSFTCLLILTVREMAVPGGPAIRATREQTQKSSQVIAAEVEAIRLREMANKMTNPELRNQYLAEAARYDAKSKQF